MTTLVRTGIVSCAALCALCATAAIPQQRSQIQQGAYTKSSPEERVDINTATLEQLLKVPGMTRTWAARIIRFRPYRAKNDLIDRGVVSEHVYARIKEYIVAHRANQ